MTAVQRLALELHRRLIHTCRLTFHLLWSHSVLTPWQTASVMNCQWEYCRYRNKTGCQEPDNTLREDLPEIPTAMHKHAHTVTHHIIIHNDIMNASDSNNKCQTNSTSSQNKFLYWVLEKLTFGYYHKELNHLSAAASDIQDFIMTAITHIRNY